MNKTQLVPPYRPYKQYMRIVISSPAEPDHSVFRGYLTRCELNTFMTEGNPSITFSIYMLPGQFRLFKKDIKEFIITDDNELNIYLRNQDNTVIRRVDL